MAMASWLPASLLATSDFGSPVLNVSVFSPLAAGAGAVELQPLATNMKAADAAATAIRFFFNISFLSSND